MAYVIGSPCNKDRACVEACPVGCIYEFEDEDRLVINPFTCIDCGACEVVCPSCAIWHHLKLPEHECQFFGHATKKFQLGKTDADNK